MSLSGKFFKSKIKKKPFSQNLQSDVELDKEKENTSKQELKPSLEENLKQLRQELGESSDIVYRTIQLTGKREIRVSVIYIDGLGDSKSIQQFILESLSQRCEQKLQLSPLDDEFKIIKDFSISVGEIKTTQKMEDVAKAILSGESAVLIDRYSEAIITGTRGWEDRGVTEPSSQTIVRGPKDGFSETLRMNTALIRRRVKDGKLRVEPKNVGRITKTDIAIVYIDGIVDPKVVEEVNSRIDKIDIDAILESGYIEELIQDETYTPFPTIYSTERPDVIVAGILEGRVGIIVDGTPFALLVPAIFTQFFQASEDYYQRADFSSLIRILRLGSFLLTLLVPSAFVAVTTFHQEMLPTRLLISLAAAREGVPFPALVEVLIMEITFEILREAGVRLPRAVGSAISIVGALVIGEAAVQAGLVSSAMVIVVSFTAITSFVIPSYNFTLAVRMLRFVFIFLAATFGLYGIILGLIALVLHLCSLRSFGVPYMESFGPFNLQDQKDSILRFPMKSLLTRPKLIVNKNQTRQQQPDQYQQKK
ncbi:spore germination protein [Neobacillus niacini]|uniref:spore germination protein n=1 Tax=Neobacillus niacini TaxID=86668 RepID=UPI002FFF3630